MGQVEFVYASDEKLLLKSDSPQSIQNVILKVLKK